MDFAIRTKEACNMARVDAVLTHPIFKERLDTLAQLEMDRIYCKHGMDHLITVARLAYIFNLERGLNLPKDLIYATSLLHDIGRSGQYLDGVPHAEGGAPLAEKILIDSGFGEEEARMAVDAIAEHSDETPTGRSSELSVILYDADKQSRDCHSCKVEHLCNWDPRMKNKTIMW